MVDLKMYSFNVRGLRDDVKRKAIFRHLKEKYPGGIYLLQETHSCQDDVDGWKREWKGDKNMGLGGDMYFDHGKTDSCGVAICLSANLDVKVTILSERNNGRILIIKLQTNDNNEFTVVNVYAPVRSKVQDQLEFLDKLKYIINELDPMNSILGGDFNTIFDPSLDKQGGDLKNATNIYTSELIAFMESNNLVDTIRTFYPNKKLFTWSQRKPLVLTRIDHWLISSHLLNIVNNVNIYPGLKSDHSIIFLNLSNISTQRGRGLWKFNSSLLGDADYVNITNELIENLKTDTESFTDAQTKWDYFKYKIMGHTIKYSTEKLKERRKLKKNLERDIETVEQELNINATDSKLQLYNSLKSELEKILEMETRGAIMRSRVDWAEAGEKNTKYFLNLEKKNAIDKNITQLESKDGKIITDPSLILKEQRHFYETLYSDTGFNIDEKWETAVNEFTDEGLTSLSDADREHCEGIITEQECAKALKNMKRGKSPGTDGFTMEFYVFFWTKIKDLVVTSLNEGYKKGKLSIDQRRGIITLIPKKGKIRTLLKNWRPISLLNMDYKILTKCLATRLHEILPLIIDTDQTGFIKGRYIGENIRTITDLIEYTSLKNQPGIILLLDFEKAFDTVIWPFLFRSLEKFNFGPMFINWVKTCYNDIESTVINNGNTAGFFTLHRGIRQGCPLSPYLFIIAVEILANAIRKNKTINGIKVDGTEFKLSQLADDTTLYLANFTSVKIALDIIDKFHKISGLKLNIDKTIAKCIGTLKTPDGGNLFGLNWTTGDIHTLGLTISNDPDVIFKENILPRLKILDNVLNIWHCRHLSLKGKVTILKSLALPKILYPVSVLPVPMDVVTIVDNMIIDFIWGKRRAKVKRNVIIQSTEHGGLKVPCFQSMVDANRIAWIKRILNDSNAKWKCILRDLVRPYSLKHFTETYLTVEDINSLKLPFYVQLYDIWNSIREPPSGAEEYLEQILWKNKFITLPIKPKSKTVKPISWPSLYLAGIVKIRDLLKDNGEVIDLANLCKIKNIKFDFLKIIRVKKAIPTQWLSEITLLKKKVQNVNITLLSLKQGENNIDICKPSTVSVTKKIYNCIVYKKIEQPTAVNKWNELFDIDCNDWPRIFKSPYIATRDTKLQSLQFKFIHRIISCEKWLYNLTVTDSPFCKKCPLEIDTIIHHFVDCGGLQGFWNNLEKWWNRTAEYSVKLTTKHILFGLYYDNLAFSTINYVLLLGKWYIKRQVESDRLIDFYNFLGLLKYNLLIERMICSKLLKMESFNKKWGKIFDYL